VPASPSSVTTKIVAADRALRVPLTYGVPRGWLGVAYDQATEEFVRKSKIAE